MMVELKREPVHGSFRPRDRRTPPIRSTLRLPLPGRRPGARTDLTPARWDSNYGLSLRRARVWSAASLGRPVQNDLYRSSAKPPIMREGRSVGGHRIALPTMGKSRRVYWRERRQ